MMISPLFIISSCKKYLDIPNPTNSVSTTAAFENKGSIDGMMNQMYSNFSGFVYGVDMARYSSAMADDGYNPTTVVNWAIYQNNNITPAVTLPVHWDFIYQVIYMANLMLEGLPGATAPGFTATDKKAYIAASKTIRACAYFQLVRFFGDVPLITDTDVPVNGVKPRDPAASIYTAIEKDLQEAIADLPGTLGTKYFINNKYIPEAVLAQVYLTQGKWAQAEAAATSIINSNLYSLATVTNVFLQSSNEGILVTAPITSFANAANNFKVGSYALQLWPEGFFKVFLEGRAFALSPDLQNSFETGDQRWLNWVKLSNTANYANPVNRMFAYKYKYNANFYTAAIPAGQEEDNKIIRLAEMYLIRAEARAQQNNVVNAAVDINRIRTRAGLANTTAATQTDMINAVLKERRVELFFEGPSRWLDLIRTGKANAVLSAISYKTANWKPTMTLLPIPATVITANPALTQNPGY